MRVRVYILPDDKPQEPEAPAPSPQGTVRPAIVRLYAGLIGSVIIWFMPKVMGWQGMQIILATAGAFGLAWLLRRMIL
ncbi:MAG TPA: hypothetical protein VNT01_01220 [Symbiobacteriaceae bacterium]|nr:hypothetical protein [Symbiobacteriaceae bacterium]